MTGEQLDFFTGLLRRILPKPPAAAPPAPRASRRTGDDAALIQQCQALLAPLGCADLAQRVRVCWSGRLRSTAGMAYPSRALIKLNPRLREFGEAEVERTLKHELAHLLAHHRVGRRRIAPHGPEWQRACIDLGLPNEARCHTLPLPRKELARRHLYRCPVCAVELRRVRPLRRATACLVCCRKHSGGRYDERFRFQKVRTPAEH